MSTPDHQPRSIEEARLMGIASVQREHAELLAMRKAPPTPPDEPNSDAAPADSRSPRRGRRRGQNSNAPSPVFALRLDPREREALRRRARLLDVPDSVLARNLIRIGLSLPPAREDWWRGDARP